MMEEAIAAGRDERRLHHFQDVVAAIVADDERSACVELGVSNSAVQVAIVEEIVHLICGKADLLQPIPHEDVEVVLVNDHVPRPEDMRNDCGYNQRREVDAANRVTACVGHEEDGVRCVERESLNSAKERISAHAVDCARAAADREAKIGSWLMAARAAARKRRHQAGCDGDTADFRVIEVGRVKVRARTVNHRKACEAEKAIRADAVLSALLHSGQSSAGENGVLTRSSRDGVDRSLSSNVDRRVVEVQPARCGVGNVGRAVAARHAACGRVDDAH